ncbi:MAG: ferritin family protein [Deltaproteobacteria bacterium]|nr:ferritin family protein [Deltaproteobacteria bacterium]
MDRISSIELAIRNEKAEMEYYFKEARRSRNPMAKSLFETLAADEKDHMIRLRALHEKLTEDGSWPEQVPIEVEGTNIGAVLDTIVRGDVSSRDYVFDDIKALKKGIEFEAEGSRFYSELADACENPREKSFFRFLSQIEREHMLSMQDSLFYLEDPEGWFESKGRAGLDGV